MKKLLLTLMVSLGFVLSSVAQKTVSGRVTDANGTPLSNVSVVVEGTTVGTTTDANGNYTINVPANGRVLAFTSLGFDGQRVTIGNRTVISPALAVAGSQELEGVVVTGITRVKRSQFAGSANTVTEKQLSDKPVGSFDQILQGNAPGIAVLTGSGQPGQPANVIIRGQNSISGGVDPLYVVDGIPVEPGVFQGMNPNDFASVEILRDAASTALYGARASSGVIVITTKRGQAGKMKVSYSGQMGVKQRPEFAFRPMNTTELLQAQHDYGAVLVRNNPADPVNNNQNMPGWFYSSDNPRYQALSDDEKLAADRALDSISQINTNWHDEIFRDGTFSNHQVTLSGGTGKTRIYSSLAKYDEEGITLRTDMSRITWMNNLDYADDKFTFRVSTNLGYTKRNFQQSTTSNSLGNPFLVSAVNVPYALATNPDGSYAVGNPALSVYQAANTLDLTSKDMNYNNQLKATLSMFGDYRINDNWNVNLTTGVDFRETQNTNYGARDAWIRINSTSITGNAGFHAEGLTRYLTATVRPMVTFNKTFKNRHEVELSGVGDFVFEKAKTLNFTGYGTDPKRPNTPAAITQGNAANQLFSTVGGSRGEATGIAGLLIARYTLDEKYTINGSFRSDGSSKMPASTRWQEFYSIGGIWNITREKFMENVSFVNVLRLRASHGSAGNSNNFPGGFYPYQSLYGQGNYAGLPTIVAATPGYDRLRWEKTTTTNVGIDYEILKRRIYGDFNWYNRVTTDLFIEKKLSATGGFGLAYPLDINAGELKNTGIEFVINGEIIRKPNLVWTVFSNTAYNKNRVTSLAGEQPYTVGTELINEGYPLGTHYEVEWAGVDAATGRPLYFDGQGNVITNTPDSARVQKFGTWEAPWKGGFGSNLTYKNFDFSVLFTWQEGSTKVDNMEYFMENPVGFMAGGYNQSSDLKFWQNPGDIVNTPSPAYGTAFSSKIIHDASFLRLRDVTIGYRVPRNILGNNRLISAARVYVQGTNLFIWTKWRGLDPEAGAVNINLSEFPNPRTLTMGVEVTF